MDKLANCKKHFTIDRTMLPIKLHFLFYTIGVSAVMTFFPIIVRNLGITATAVGILYTVAPFTTIVANPSLGWITDKLKKVKFVIMALVIFQTPLFMSVAFIPSIPSHNQSYSLNLTCISPSTYILAVPNSLPLKYSNCSLSCKMNCGECQQLRTNNSSDSKLCESTVELEILSQTNASYSTLHIQNTTENGTQPPSCNVEINDQCKANCYILSAKDEESVNVYSTYQFWTVLFITMFTLVATNATLALGDAACYEALEGRVNMYGKQKLWVSVGWGFGCLITGYILDLANPDGTEKVDFSYCSYIMLVLIVIDIISLSQATLKKPPTSKHILKDVGKVFSKPHPIIFALAVLFAGCFECIQLNYMFWYLEDLGASKTLLGLAIAEVSFLVEVPFYFIAGWVVKRIGRDITLVLSFTSYAFWFLTISFIYNPWWILLIQLSQGPSYGLFFCAMTSYGKIVTAPGTEATIQTVLGALFHGVGVGCGGLLAGLGFDLYGGRLTYRFCGYLAITVGVCYKLLTTFVAGESTAIYKGDDDGTKKTQRKSVLTDKIEYNHGLKSGK